MGSSRTAAVLGLALRYGWALAQALLLGVGVAILVTVAMFFLSEPGEDGSSKARLLGRSIAIGMNTGTLVALVGVPVALVRARRRAS